MRPFGRLPLVTSVGIIVSTGLLIAGGQGTDGSDHAYLTDFGLTKQRGSQTDLTRTGGLIGTLDYISPEQIVGRPADARADQYALAGVAVSALTGTPPFPRKRNRTWLPLIDTWRR